MLTCKKCGDQKPESAFYPSNKGTCKECVKVQVRANRAEKVDYYRAYDRQRTKRPERIAHLRTQSVKFRRENPEKYAAHVAVSNAVRDGKLKKQPCIVCKSGDAHAHHEDYSKPLDVIWLCPEHHQQYHMIRREAEKITESAA